MDETKGWIKWRVQKDGCRFFSCIISLNKMNGNESLPSAEGIDLFITAAKLLSYN